MSGWSAAVRVRVYRDAEALDTQRLELSEDVEHEVGKNASAYAGGRGGSRPARTNSMDMHRQTPS